MSRTPPAPNDHVTSSRFTSKRGVFLRFVSKHSASRRFTSRHMAFRRFASRHRLSVTTQASTWLFVASRASADFPSFHEQARLFDMPRKRRGFPILRLTGHVPHADTVPEFRNPIIQQPPPPAVKCFKNFCELSPLRKPPETKTPYAPLNAWAIIATSASVSCLP